MVEYRARTKRMIHAMLALASLLSAPATEAGKSSNSFLTVEGEGVSIADDGGHLRRGGRVRAGPRDRASGLAGERARVDCL